MIKMAEWFGGIGAYTHSMVIPHEVYDYVELDKNAVKSYNAINGTNFEPKDINDVDVSNYPELDILVAGWPCQDYSIAGKSFGLEGDRSSLILLTIEKIREMKNKPKYILLENVKNILSKRHSADFEYILKLFDELGYNWSYALLNSLDFGVPQSRERVFILLTRKDLPQRYVQQEKRKHIGEKINLNDCVDYSDKLEWNTITREEIDNADYGKGIKKVYTNYMYLPPKDPSKPLNNLEGRRLWHGSYVGTIPAGQAPKIYKIKNNDVYYRSLTAKECWKIMGFSDDAFEKVKSAGISEAQMRKQAGNSIVVNILKWINWDIFYNEYLEYNGQFRKK